MLRKIKNAHLLSLLTMVFGLTLSFVGGIFAEETRLEQIAEYATKVVNSNTENKKYCAITVEKTIQSGPLRDAYDEFISLYGTFKQTKITFSSAINADKRHEVFMQENDSTISENLSFLYLGPVGTVEYNHHYKHYVYPVEVMFPDERLYDFNRYVIYISQSHANKLLAIRGLGERDEYTKEEYASLLKTNLSLSIDGGEASVFIIQNIYYQQNYYYDGLKETIGDFAMVSYFMPLNLRDEQQNIYFMSGYDYQNKYFMEYINRAYSNKKYSVKVNHYNINKKINDEYLLSFYYGSKNGNWDWLSAIFMVFAVVSTMLSLFFHAFISKKTKLTNHILSALCLLAPYCIFYLIYFLTKNVLFLSRSATRMYSILSLLYIISYVIIFFLKKHNIIKKISVDKEGQSHENVDI